MILRVEGKGISWLWHPSIPHRGVRFLISQSLDRRLPLCKRIALDLHLRVCGECRLYKSQMEVMRRALRMSREAEYEEETPVQLSLEARERIRSLLEKWTGE